MCSHCCCLKLDLIKESFVGFVLALLLCGNHGLQLLYRLLYSAIDLVNLLLELLLNMFLDLGLELLSCGACIILGLLESDLV